MTDQRNLNTKASIADMAAKLENDRRENVRKLSQAHDVSARMVCAALMRTAMLSKKSANKLFYNTVEYSREIYVCNTNFATSVG